MIDHNTQLLHLGEFVKAISIAQRQDVSAETMYKLRDALAEVIRPVRQCSRQDAISLANHYVGIVYTGVS